MLGVLLGEFWPYIAGAVGLLSVFLFGRSGGKKSAELKMKRKDGGNARNIRKRVDETIENLDSDSRPVDDRLRGKGRLRD